MIRRIGPQKSAVKKVLPWYRWAVLSGCMAFLIVFALGAPGGSIKLSARTDAGSIVTPEIFPRADNDCQLGLIGACNDQSQYVSGPESILQSWFFSKAVPWWISFVISLTAGIAVLMIMVGGIIIMIAAENTELRGRGVKAITWALIGLVIALFAFTIVAILENLPLPGSTAPSSTISR